MTSAAARLRPGLERHGVWAAACGAGVTAGVVAGDRPAAVVLLAAAVVTGIALLLRAELAIHATIVAAFVTLPARVPAAVHHGPFVIRLYEPFLAVAVVYTVARCRPGVAVQRAVVALVAVVVLAGVLGLVGGADPVHVVNEGQLLLDLAAGYLVAAGVVRHGRGRAALHTVTAVLWWSAGVLVLASLGLVRVAGRTETAHLGDVSSGAVRLLTATQFPALAVVCAVTALLVTGRIPVRVLVLPAVPAVVVVALAFSRNTLLALGVCLLVAIAVGGFRALGRTALATVVAVVLAVPGVLLGRELLAGTRVGDWLATQGSGYGLRVLGGLSSHSADRDPSLRYRAEETSSLLTGVRDSPLVGHGLGYTYHRPSGERGTFDVDLAPYYAHDFWLWLAVKVGVPGAAVVIVALVVPVATAVIRGRAQAGPVAAGATAVALLTVCVVAPLPLDSPTSLLLGGVLGGAAGWAIEGAGAPEPGESQPDPLDVVAGGNRVE